MAAWPPGQDAEQTPVAGIKRSSIYQTQLVINILELQVSLAWDPALLEFPPFIHHSLQSFTKQSRAILLLILNVVTASVPAMEGWCQESSWVLNPDSARRHLKKCSQLSASMITKGTLFFSPFLMSFMEKESLFLTDESSRVLLGLCQDCAEHRRFWSEGVMQGGRFFVARGRIWCLMGLGLDQASAWLRRGAQKQPHTPSLSHSSGFWHPRLCYWDFTLVDLILAVHAHFVMGTIC